MAIAANEVLFSVLLLSIPSRLNQLQKLYNKLQTQIGNQPVEVLTLVDNKSMTIGEKRNKLLSCARGRHLAFLDDDDDVSNDYILSILSGLKAFSSQGPDVLTFMQHCTVNGKTFLVDFDLNNPHEPAVVDANGNYRNIARPPYHMCVWKSVIAKNTPFPDISYGEDLSWILQLKQRARSQYKVQKVLHYYKYDDQTSESIQFRGQ